MAIPTRVWRCGQREGRGILSRATGDVQLGLWRNDELHVVSDAEYKAYVREGAANSEWLRPLWENHCHPCEV